MGKAWNHTSRLTAAVIRLPGVAKTSDYGSAILVTALPRPIASPAELEPGKDGGVIILRYPLRTGYRTVSRSVDSKNQEQRKAEVSPKDFLFTFPTCIKVLTVTAEHECTGFRRRESTLALT